jgi:hypothetical protein
VPASLADLNATPRTITLGGEPYAVHPLTLADQGELQAWLDAQLPNPLDQAFDLIQRRNLPQPQAQYVLRNAQEMAAQTRIFLNSPEALPYLNSANGIVEILFLAIRKGRADFTRERAKDLIGGMTPAAVLKLQQATQLDMVLSGGDDGSDGPKA